MILAAGMGSRLRPLTDTCPKALIDIQGVPMLEIVIKRLIAAGVDSVVVNAFHLVDRIEDFLESKCRFGIRVEVSREAELLDTGGGLKKVASFFDDGRPFFLHNVDVLSGIDLKKMYRFHQEKSALATLAVQTRKSGRFFLFNKNGLLRGWESAAENRREWAGPPTDSVERLAFSGIHVLSPAVFPKIKEEGVFSITRAYLRLAAGGEKIQAFRCDEYPWRDIGSLAQLEEARRHAESRGLSEF